MTDTHEQVTLTVRACMAVRGENMRTLSRGSGLNMYTLRGRMYGQTKWTLDDLGLLAGHYGIRPWDLMQGPAEALRRIDASVKKGAVPA